MKKKRAILNFAGLIFVALVLIVLSVVKFTIPGTSDNFMGFLRAIDLGLDYKGGIKVTLEAKNNSSSNVLNFSNGVNAHILRMQSILSENNFDANIFSIANNNIAIEVDGVYSSDDILELINNTTNNTLSFKAEDSVDADAYITAEDISDCYALQYNSTYYVYIEFTSHGREQLKSLSNQVLNGNKTIYIYIGDSKYKEISGISSTLDQDYLMFNDGSNSTQENASKVAGRILATKYDFSFEKIGETIITEEIAQKNLLLSCIFVGVVVLVCLIILVLRFKKLGLVNALSLLLGLLVQIVMLQAVPIITLTSTALVASLITFVLGFAMTYYMLSTIAGEYAVGKKVNSSFKFGYQKSSVTILEIMLTIFVASLVFYIFGSTLIKHFALAMIIGTIIYGLCVLLLTKWFNKMCFDLHSNHAKQYGFRREENVNELEEI